MSERHQFADWFTRAPGHEPYLFQIRFADRDWLRNAVPVPGHGVRASLSMRRLGWARPRWRCWGGCGGVKKPSQSKQERRSPDRLVSE